MKPKKYHFSGWATRNDIECADGRTIRKNAFADQDGTTVPLVYQHDHKDMDNVLGHAILENRSEGVYTYGVFNDTPAGKTAKSLVANGDLRYLSIYANKLRQEGGDVIHGKIREVSLVLAGANPGAFIDSPVVHGEELDTEATIYSGIKFDPNQSEFDEDISHSDDDDEVEDEKEEKTEEPSEEFEDTKEETIEHSDDKTDTKEEKSMPDTKTETKTEGKEKTVQDVFNSFTDEQKNVVYYMIGAALEEAGVSPDDKNTNKGDEEDVAKHNVFENEEHVTGAVISHSDISEVIQTARKKGYGSLKDALNDLAVDNGFDNFTDAMMHDGIEGLDNVEYTSDTYGNYGIGNIGYLFPEAKSLNTPPEFIKRPTEWVAKVMGKTKHTPFSRVKSMFADITADEARAKGYTKGKRKLEEVFTLLKRKTEPTTIYKKQKLDRDDIIDITDFDVIAWLKVEMRGMLDEEIARAILIGDGRSNASDDKISEDHIRPVWTDEDLFVIQATFPVAASDTADDRAKAFIRTIIKQRKNYRGTGNPDLYVDEDILTDILLLEDLNGRTIYDDVNKLATKLRVNEIIPVPVLENKTRVVSGVTRTLHGILVNLTDYNIGADKGGAVSMFEDFDIDYNQQKYLIETRCSGALIKPYSAMVVESYQTSSNSNDSEG